MQQGHHVVLIFDNEIYSGLIMSEERDALPAVKVVIFRRKFRLTLLFLHLTISDLRISTDIKWFD